MSLKSLFAAKDMTQGAPWQRILEFSIPMLLGNVAQQLYNTADSVIVGIYVGDNALAAWPCSWASPPALVLSFPSPSVPGTGRVCPKPSATP